MIEVAAMQDTLAIAMGRGRELLDEFGGKGLVGYGAVCLTGPDGQIKQLDPFANIITTAGDQYYSRMAIIGVLPANAGSPTLANGMKLGTSTTAATKSGAAAAIVTYLTASNAAFDTAFPTASAVAGTDTGWNVTYKTTWAAGVATSTTINEVAVVNDSATNAVSTAANTYARAVITTVNKAAGDSLAITWTHKFLGA